MNGILPIIIMFGLSIFILVIFFTLYMIMWILPKIWIGFRRL